MAEVVRMTRPVAVDVRDWRDQIMAALNDLNVHVGEEFELRAVEKSTRPSIAPAERPKRLGQGEIEAAEEIEAEEPEVLF